MGVIVATVCLGVVGTIPERGLTRCASRCRNDVGMKQGFIVSRSGQCILGGTFRHRLRSMVMAIWTVKAYGDRANVVQASSVHSIHSSIIKQAAPETPAKSPTLEATQAPAMFPSKIVKCISSSRQSHDHVATSTLARIMQLHAALIS